MDVDGMQKMATTFGQMVGQPEGDRYYDTVIGCEQLEPNENTVVLPPDNVFWHPLPEGHQFVYDENNIPIGTEPIPLPEPGTDDGILMSCAQNEITMHRISMAMLRAHNGNSQSVDSINSKLAQIAQNHGTTVDYVLMCLDEKM